MHAPARQPLYRHIDVALLRAAASPLTNAPKQWPDLTDTGACREWLDRMWSRPDLADAVRQASPSLADRVDGIYAGRSAGDKQIRRAATAVARYLLRATGRPTPFGLFAGVAPVTLGRVAGARWGDGHRSVARVNTEWLADIIARLEACPDLLERLNVVVTDLAVRRGGRREVPQGPNRVTIRHTSAIAAVWDAATVPVRFGAGRLVIDTYHPETGRYGHGAAMSAAEDVFAADSQAVAATLRSLFTRTVHPTALIVVNMLGIVNGFLGELADSMNWLIARSVPAMTDRAGAEQAIQLAQHGSLRDLSGWTDEIDQAWQARADALAAYRKQLPTAADSDDVLESLLHMHHNRAIGIDSESERTCRRLARQAALTWRARQRGDDR